MLAGEIWLLRFMELWFFVALIKGALDAYRASILRQQMQILQAQQLSRQVSGEQLQGTYDQAVVNRARNGQEGAVR